MRIEMIVINCNMNRSTETFAQVKYRTVLLTSENDVNMLFLLRKT